jgi:uncharacterized protein YggE
MKSIFTVLLCVLAITTTYSQSARSSISVVGEAKMSVSPDQVVFTFEVVTGDKELAAAKRANDTRSAKTLTAAKDFGIASQDLQTDSLTISPQYTGSKDPRGEHVLIGYEVTKRIFVTLQDLDKIDTFLSRSIEAGVNRVVTISIENSQMQKFQEQVRAMAVKNAQAKAKAYAQQLGQTVGPAYVIREEGADSPSLDTGSGSGNGNGNGMGDSDIAHMEGTPKNPFVSQVTFALGQIEIEEKVYVIFELKP